MQRAKETGFMWTIYYHWTWWQFAKQKKSNKIKRRKKRREIKTFAWLFFEFIWIIDGCTGLRECLQNAENICMQWRFNKQHRKRIYISWIFGILSLLRHYTEFEPFRPSNLFFDCSRGSHDTSMHRLNVRNQMHEI